MSRRDRALQEFLKSLASALQANIVGVKASAAIARVCEALQTPRPAGDINPQRRPVCSYLNEALALARSGSVLIARVADAFAAIEPSLTWAPRQASGPFASENWPEGHANTMIIGPKGLEDRNDVLIGASLLVPHVRYPDHNHAPEEVYLVLTPGRFQHGDSDWFEPGIGGTLYNEPNIKHAMASGNAPLLAIWCLWNAA